MRSNTLQQYREKNNKNETNKKKEEKEKRKKNEWYCMTNTNNVILCQGMAVTSIMVSFI